MAVKALYDYRFEPQDTEDKFHGNQLVYVCWDQHLMFCSPVCVPLPPDMPFGAFVKEVLPGMYDTHPDWPQIQWDQVEWIVDGKHFQPHLDKGLRDQGIVHKSLIRFRTPGLNGIAGVAS